MRTVHKYSVPVDDQVHEIDMPSDSQITLVQCQYSSASVEFWAAVNADRPYETRSFRVIGTGHEIHALESVIGSTLSAQGALVWHLLEVSS